MRDSISAGDETFFKEKVMLVLLDLPSKFRRQIKDIACVVDAWWLWTKESLAEYEVGKEIKAWLLSALLPVLYRHNQREKP